MAVPDIGVHAAPPQRSLRDLVERERRRHVRKRVLWVSIVAALPVLVVAAWLALRPRPVPLLERFRSEAITLGNVVREVHATGNVEAVTTVQVGAETSGRIATVEVDYNDHVKAGQVLARFDPALLDAQVAQARANATAARAGLEQAKTDRAKALQDERRAGKLLAEKLVSQADYETAKATADVASQRVHTARSQLAAQQAALKLAQTNKEHAVIRSPIDGIVITRNIDPGQTVASVFQTPVLFTVAADLKKMEVVAAVDEADIGEVRVGDHASFTVTAYGERAFKGVVTEVRNSPVVVQDVVTYGTVVGVDNPKLLLKPGMTASVRIVTATASGVLRVPNAALHFTPPGEKAGAKPAVWVLEQGALRRIAVKPGITGEETTEVARGPLSAKAPVLTELTTAGRKAYGLSR